MATTQPASVPSFQPSLRRGQNGEYKIVKDVQISEFSQKMLNATAEELYAERDEALSFLQGGQ